MKIGDRVIARRSYDGNRQIIGEKGILTIGGGAGANWGVVFENNISGHALGRLCEEGYGYWIPESYLELVPKEYHFCNPLCEKCMKNPREVVLF